MSHRVRGAAITLLASLALGVLMFFPRVLTFGVGLGVVLVALVAVGLLDFFGALKIDPHAPSRTRPEPVPLDDAPRPLKLLAGFDRRILWTGLGLFAAGLSRLSVIGTPGAAAPWSGPVLLGLALAAIVIARVRRRPYDGRLHGGFLVIALATGTIMATLGSHGLWDCWETHYGEVARRQLEQDDWIGLYWQDNWFFSKPILIFWLMNLGMALFGVKVGPDEITAHAEWGVRFFVGVLAIAVIWSVYRLLASRVSRRAGLFAAVVLATMPLYAFMARQAITDLPFVGLMTIAVVCFLFGITAAPEAEARPVHVPLGRGRSLPLSGFHLVIAGYVAVAVPQFVYLATRSATFRFGSLGTGNIRPQLSKGVFLDVSLSDYFKSILGVRLGGPVDLSLDWLVLGLAYTLPFLILLFTLRRERRVARLYFHAMYLCLALSVMAKGLPGLAMPILGLFGLWAVASPWRSVTEPGELWRTAADALRLLLFPLTLLIWLAKLLLRLVSRGTHGAGPVFTSRLLAWHFEKLRRLDIGRGIALFLLTASPWYVAMIVRHGDRFINRFFIHDHIKRLSVGVHGENGTFQYYVQQFGYAAFPWVALVPFALLSWIWLRRRAAADGSEPDRSRRLIQLFCLSWAVLSFALLAMMVTKFHHYIFPLLPPMALVLGLFLDDVWRGRIKPLGLLMLLGVIVLGVVARDLLAHPDKGKGVLSGYAQLVGLFIYKYSRPYPDGPQYDIQVPLAVFTAVFAVLLAGWVPERLRRVAMLLTVVAALAFTHWLTQHHMIALAPHWTQKHLIEEYYARRRSPAERLVAFQMNWKGENFYTGNRVLVYVSTKNQDFEKWINKHRGERHFFVTEHARFNRMSKRADAASGPLKPFADTCNKYKAGWADEL